MEKQKKHGKAKKIILIVCVIIAILVGGFLIYSADYYHADAMAMDLAQGSDVQKTENFLIVTPEQPSDTALIFYPGAKVEAEAYLPLLEKLKDRGITSVLVKMPLNMAIFNTNAADKVYALLPNIKHWYIGGHSMGGAMASAYAAKNQDKVDGLILLGAYIYGDYPPDDALTIYGTFNSNLEKDINYTENIVVIDGGNHAGFGNYGKQSGDPDATITAEQQQTIAADAIAAFVKDKNSAADKD